ncbi:MAG: hypothetical protein U0900_00235 [Myxococcota bacterium]
MRLILTWLGALLTFAAAPLASALDPRLDVGGFREEDRAIAEELAGYDAQDRHAALVAAGEPETLLSISEIQNDSADAFAKLIDGLPRADQEQVWDIVRYPGLVADLARGGEKTDADLERIAARHPEEIRAAIRSEGRKRYSTWVEVYALDLEAERDFAGVLSEHPADVRTAFQRLRARPDLMTLLVDNVGVATRIGAAYRADPTRVEARFDGLHQDVVAQRSQQEKTWAQEMQDPKKREALQSAAREFANEHGYALDDGTNANNNANTNGNPNATTTQTRVIRVDNYVNTNPYPYWFGYPSWYAYPYWYPASVWTHVGFRWGGGGTYVGIGLPSPYFLGWYGNYYGGGYGYGYPYAGYGFGYGLGGYYGGFNSWAYPGRYYWGGGYSGSHHHHGGSSYSHHRPRTFDGHRPHQRYDSRVDGGRSGHRFDGNRSGGRLGSGHPRGHHPGAAGSPGSGLSPSQSGGGRIDRGHRAYDARRDGGTPAMRGGGHHGRHGPPNVSSGPSGPYARHDRMTTRPNAGLGGRHGGRQAFHAGTPQGFDRGLARTRLERGLAGHGGRSSGFSAPYGLGGDRRGHGGGGGPAHLGRSMGHGGGRGASIGGFSGGGGHRGGGGISGGGHHAGGFSGGGHHGGGHHR